MSTLRERISQYDLIYDSPACGWMDGISIGNGSLCALAYEAERAYPEFLVNHHALWDNRVSEFHRHSMADIRRIATKKMSFREEMKKEMGLWLTSGEDFRGNGRYFVRMNLATSYRNVVEGCRRLKAFLDKKMG